MYQSIRQIEGRFRARRPILLVAYGLAPYSKQANRVSAWIEAFTQAQAQSHFMDEQRSVFIICEAGSDIHLLMEIFSQLGLRTLNRDPLLEPIVSLAATTREYIDRADVVCVILDEDASPNVYFELGYALGQRRPIAVIGNKGKLPADFQEAFRIGASLQDRSALSFQLRAFVSNLRDNGSYTISTPPLRSARTFSGRKLKSIAVPRSSLERDLLEVLELAPEIDSIAYEPKNKGAPGYYPDFAVWLSAAARILESPVVIEVTSGHANAIDRAIERLISFSRASEVGTGLVLVEGLTATAPRVASLSPLIFVLPLVVAKNLLGNNKLVETLVSERNRFAHSAG